MLKETRIAAQKMVGGINFPAIVSPDPALQIDFRRFVDGVRDHRPRLENLLHSSGAVLLRGFPAKTAADFNAAVEAFGYEEFSYVGGVALRTNVVGRVFTANESPPDRKIPFHHEMAQVPECPSKLFFFCEVEPTSGGETPIVLSHHVYQRMKEKHPEFVEKLEKHGLIYTRVLGIGDDPSSAIGRGWHSTFLTKDRNIAEERNREKSRLGDSGAAHQHPEIVKLGFCGMGFGSHVPASWQRSETTTVGRSRAKWILSSLI